MDVTLTVLHWVYLAGVVFVIVAMCLRKDVVLPCAIFTILSGFAATGSIAQALLTEARALLFAFSEFQSLILGIGIMVMMSKQMADMGTGPYFNRTIGKNYPDAYHILFCIGYRYGADHRLSLAFSRHCFGRRTFDPYRSAGRYACHLGCCGNEYVRSRLYDVP